MLETPLRPEPNPPLFPSSLKPLNYHCCCQEEMQCDVSPPPLQAFSCWEDKELSAHSDNIFGSLYQILPFLRCNESCCEPFCNLSCLSLEASQLIKTSKSMLQ